MQPRDRQALAFATMPTQPTDDRSATSDVTRRSFIRTAGTGLLAAATMPATTQLAPPDRQPPNLRLPETKKPVGYAIVGLGVLAINEILPAFARCKKARPVALVSGHPDKAQKLAGVYGIDPAKIYNYEDYDRIAQDDAIDVVFIVLPNHMHAEYTIRALRAKKHVLCEKPVAATVDESRQMVAAAKENDRQLMIAYRLHYEPFNMKAMELARDRERFGLLKTFEATNNQNVQPPNIRLSKQTAGGPLGDVGVYCLNAARYISGEEPIEVTAQGHQPTDDPRFAEVAESIVWTMKFPSGALAHCGCSFGSAGSRYFRATGTKGVIDMDDAFAYSGQRLTMKQGRDTTEMQLEPVNHFAAEMDHFADVVTGQANCKTPGEDGLRDMIAIDAIHRSINEGRTIKIEQA